MNLKMYKWALTKYYISLLAATANMSFCCPLLGSENDDVDLDAYQHEWIEVELLPQNEDDFGSGNDVDTMQADIKKSET